MASAASSDRHRNSCALPRRLSQRRKRFLSRVKPYALCLSQPRWRVCYGVRQSRQGDVYRMPLLRCLSDVFYGSVLFGYIKLLAYFRGGCLGREFLLVGAPYRLREREFFSDIGTDGHKLGAVVEILPLL